MEEVGKHYFSLVYMDFAAITLHLLAVLWLATTLARTNKRKILSNN